MEANARRIRWSVAPSWAALDPRRFLGTVTELPQTAAPGEWCRVVLVDDAGELCWTLVADDVERTASMFLERRPPRLPSDAVGWSSERVAERVGADGSDTTARKTEGGTDQGSRSPGSAEVATSDASGRCLASARVPTLLSHRVARGAARPRHGQNR